MTRLEGIRKSLDIRRKDLETALHAQHAADSAFEREYWTDSAVRYRQDIEHLEAELRSARSHLQVVQ